MFSAILATADLLTDAFRGHLPSLFSRFDEWVGVWQQYYDIRRFRSVRADIYRDLAQYLQDSTDLHDAIPRLLFVYSDEGKSSSHPAVPVLRAWSRSEYKNLTLPELLRGWAPSFDCMMIQSGQRAGADDQGAALPKMIYKTVAQIDLASEMRYLFLEPVLRAGGGLVVGLAYVGYLAVGITPQVLTFAPKLSDLGLLANSLVWLSDFLQSPWSLLTLVPLSYGIWWVTQSFANWTSPSRRWADKHIEFYAIYKATRGATFLKALAPLLAIGKDVSEALDILAEEGNPYERSRIGAAARISEKEGVGLGSALHRTKDVFPDNNLIHRLMAAEGRRREHVMIEDMADRHLQDVRRRITAFGFWMSFWVQFAMAAIMFYGLFAQFQLTQALNNAVAQ